MTNNEFAIDLNKVNLERLKDKDCGEAERIALGMVLHHSGMSLEQSSETVGVSVHKLWKKVSPRYPDDKKDALLEQLALDASIHLSLEIMDRVNRGDMRSAEVIKAAQVMTNIVGRKRKWDAPTPKEGELQEKSAMERLLEALEGGKLVATGSKEVEG